MKQTFTKIIILGLAMNCNIQAISQLIEDVYMDFKAIREFSRRCVRNKKKSQQQRNFVESTHFARSYLFSNVNENYNPQYEWSQVYRYIATFTLNRVQRVPYMSYDER